MTAHNARRTEAFENSSYLYTFVCLHMWKTTAHTHTHSLLSLSEFYSPAEQEAGSAQSFRKIYTHIYAHRKLHVIPVLWVCVRVVLSEWMKWILSNSAPYRTSHRYAPHLLPFHFTGYFFLPKIQPWMHSFANFNVNYFECVWVFFLLMCQQHMQWLWYSYNKTNGNPSNFHECLCIVHPCAIWYYATDVCCAEMRYLVSSWIFSNHEFIITICVACRKWNLYQTITLNSSLNQSFNAWKFVFVVVWLHFLLLDHLHVRWRIEFISLFPKSQQFIDFKRLIEKKNAIPISFNSK